MRCACSCIQRVTLLIDTAPLWWDGSVHLRPWYHTCLLTVLPNVSLICHHILGLVSWLVFSFGYRWWQWALKCRCVLACTCIFVPLIGRVLLKHSWNTVVCAYVCVSGKGKCCFNHTILSRNFVLVVLLGVRSRCRYACSRCLTTSWHYLWSLFCSEYLADWF